MTPACGSSLGEVISTSEHGAKERTIQRDT